jgi:ketol-acid reductoisomerase
MAVNGVNGNSGATSGDHASITPGNIARRLSVPIVGAGIGGLMAAVGLRLSGHNVAVGLNPSPSKPVLLA